MLIEAKKDEIFFILSKRIKKFYVEFFELLLLRRNPTKNHNI